MFTLDSLNPFEKRKQLGFKKVNKTTFGVYETPFGILLKTGDFPKAIAKRGKTQVLKDLKYEKLFAKRR